jgi:hypothetical protein
MIISPYAPSLFLSLPDFWTAKHSLERTKGHLKELGTMICRYGLQERVGVSLLHKHFTVYSNEQLVKHFVGNSAYIRLYPQSIDENIVPYLWKLEHDEETGVQSFYPLEFVDTVQRASRARTDAQKFVSSEMFLAEIAAKLCALNLENVFGLCTLHGNSEIVLGDEEILLETTDHVNRVLTLAPAAKTLTETTETSWQFTFDGSGDDTTKWKGRSKGHCKSYCTSHCKNHKE